MSFQIARGYETGVNRTVIQLALISILFDKPINSFVRFHHEYAFCIQFA